MPSPSRARIIVVVTGGIWRAFCCLLAAACGGAQGPPTAFEGEEQGLYAGQIMSRDVERGAFVFHHTCAACHQGRVNPSGYGWEPWRMRRQVRQGNHLMPPLSDELVSEDDLEAVLAFLTTIGAVEGALLPELIEPTPRAVATSLGPGNANELGAPPPAPAAAAPPDDPPPAPPIESTSPEDLPPPPATETDPPPETPSPPPEARLHRSGPPRRRAG